MNWHLKVVWMILILQNTFIFLYVCYLQNKQSIPHEQAENKNFPQLDLYIYKNTRNNNEYNRVVYIVIEQPVVIRRETKIIISTNISIHCCVCRKYIQSNDIKILPYLCVYFHQTKWKLKYNQIKEKHWSHVVKIIYFGLTKKAPFLTLSH